MTIFNIISLFGGLALFLYGMRLMGDGLKSGASDAVKSAMEKVTNTPLVGFLLGLGVTAVILLLVCLITKKGYSWFSGYKFTRDPRGFDILPDGTHGTSCFSTK